MHRKETNTPAPDPKSEEMKALRAKNAEDCDTKDPKECKDCRTNKLGLCNTKITRRITRVVTTVYYDDGSSTASEMP